MKQRVLLTSLVCVVCFIASALLALQGWGGRITSFDLVPHAMEAERFLVDGVFPNHGCLSSFGSYIPPGTSWLIVPGQWLFQDPRLELAPGALALFVLSVCGVYRLARWCFNRGAALCAVALFCAAPVSLGMAVSLWPRFPMAATVWFAYFTARWAYDRKPHYLGTALLVLLLGLYVHLEGVILVIALPLVWLIARPPVWSRYVFIALVLGLVVWLPYLKFEHGRGYVDLKSQFTRHSIFYETETLARVETMAREYNLPFDKFRPPAPNHGSRPLSLKAKVLESADDFAVSAVRAMTNVGANWSGYGWGDLLSAGLGTVVLLFALAQPINSLKPVAGGKGNLECGGLTPLSATPRLTKAVSKGPLTAIGLGLILLALVANEWVLARFLSADGRIEDYTIRPIRFFQVVLASTGVILLVRKPILIGMKRLAAMPATPLGTVALVLVPPWLLLMWMAAPDAPYRFWFLWPLHLVVMVGMFTLLPGCFTWGKAVTRVLLVVALMILVVNSAVLGRIKEWREHGWRSESEEVCALNCLGEAIVKERGKKVAVGYIMPFQPFMAYYHVLDSQYKVGLPYDWYLLSTYGVRNLNSAPKGVSDEDHYRFVAARRNMTIEMEPLVVPMSGWQKGGEIGSYFWWRRNNRKSIE